MEYIKWNDEMSVNINSIDLQHQKLITEINNFYNDLGKKKNADILSGILYQLKKYSIYHFDTEEALMRKFGFKGYIDHKIDHGLFIKKIDDLQSKLDEGKMVLTLELASFLKDWLSNHILKTDKEYSKFLNECGVK